jgi:hypothetical protein
MSHGPSGLVTIFHCIADAHLCRVVTVCAASSCALVCVHVCLHAILQALVEALGASIPDTWTPWKTFSELLPEDHPASGMPFTDLLPLVSSIPGVIVSELPGKDRGKGHRLKRFPCVLAAGSVTGAGGVGHGAATDAQVPVVFRALVVGNIEYTNAPRLGSCERDAQDMADLLACSGYAVNLLLNCTKDSLMGAVSALVASLPSKESCCSLVLYFSGHGASSEGRNFLVPVDGIVGDAGVGTQRFPLIRTTAQAHESVQVVRSNYVPHVCWMRSWLGPCRHVGPPGRPDETPVRTCCAVPVHTARCMPDGLPWLDPERGRRDEPTTQVRAS